jgi:uncharacterized protein (DUF488 family)
MAETTSHVQIFTIGHSSHPLGSFLWLLQKHGVSSLVDVRRYPGSKRHLHFSREILSGSVEEDGIKYHWLEALGGNRRRAKDAPPSHNRGIEDESFRNYADYMATDEFKQGVTTLLEIAADRRTAIMCAEGDYAHCHRRLLSSSFALFGEEIGIGEKRPTVQNLENSTTSSQKHGGRRWNLLKLSWHC